MEIILYFIVVPRGNAAGAYWQAILPGNRAVTHFLKRGNVEGRRSNYVSAWEALDDFQWSCPHNYPSKRLPMVIV